ncbi:MAG: hypothetical protein RMM53_11345, partial [Bacteroidia bacterium]|nr:hypothetical protein [Bacteroidia bacterium]
MELIDLTKKAIEENEKSIARYMNNPDADLHTSTGEYFYATNVLNLTDAAPVLLDRLNTLQLHKDQVKEARTRLVIQIENLLAAIGAEPVFFRSETKPRWKDYLNDLTRMAGFYDLHLGVLAINQNALANAYGAKVGTLVEETSHLIVEWVRQNDPQRFERLKKAVQGSYIWERVASIPAYANEGEAAIVHEAIAKTLKGVIMGMSEFVEMPELQESTDKMFVYLEAVLQEKQRLVGLGLREYYDLAKEILAVAQGENEALKQSLRLHVKFTLTHLGAFLQNLVLRKSINYEARKKKGDITPEEQKSLILFKERERLLLEQLVASMKHHPDLMRPFLEAVRDYVIEHLDVFMENDPYILRLLGIFVRESYISHKAKKFFEKIKKDPEKRYLYEHLTEEEAATFEIMEQTLLSSNWRNLFHMPPEELALMLEVLKNTLGDVIVTHFIYTLAFILVQDNQAFSFAISGIKRLPELQYFLEMYEATKEMRAG